jgi:LPXTG-motif cell wall-anchored protein
LGTSSRRQPTLPVTGPTNVASLTLIAMMCFGLGGFALTRSRKHGQRHRP